MTAWSRSSRRLLQQSLGSTIFRRGKSSSTSTVDPADASQVANIVAKAFDKEPRKTAIAIMDRLDELDRVHLLVAFQSVRNEALRFAKATEYADDLVKTISKDSPHRNLGRAEVANAIEMQRYMQRYTSYAHTSPSTQQLLKVALAAGLPFIGFGFVDNAIMITAGEQIDHLVGLRLGITTMASAGLGNIVADVVGVSVTQQIKQTARSLDWAQPPKLSMLQQNMTSVRAAKLLGAACGVSLGCILGMSPLAVMTPGFFVQ